MTTISAILCSIITLILGFILGREYKPPREKPEDKFYNAVQDQIRKDRMRNRPF